MDADFLQVPVQIKRILLDFTLSCLQSGTVDYVGHGCEYFTLLLQRRQAVGDNNFSKSLKLNQKKMAERRESVLGELFDLREVVDFERIVVPKTVAEIERLAAVIKHILLFKDLDPDELSQVMDAMAVSFVERGDLVIVQGDTQADHFYVVNDGVFEASLTSDEGEKKVVRTYDNHGSFGELALMYNGPRAATVRAVTDGKLWVLDRVTFQKIVLASSYRRRDRYCSLIENVDFLKTLNNYEKFDLADSLSPKIYSDGEEIFHQGDVADGMYFIETGGVRCTMEHPVAGQINVQILEAGSYLGELALLTSMKRALSAYAVGTTKLAFLDKDTFERLLGSCVEFLSRNFVNYDEALRQILESKNIDLVS